MYLVFWFFLAISITWNVMEYCAYFLNIWRIVSKDFRPFFTFLRFFNYAISIFMESCSTCSSQIGYNDSKGKKQKKKTKKKKKKKKNYFHQELNSWPLDPQPNAIPLSYHNIWQKLCQNKFITKVWPQKSGLRNLKLTYFLGLYDSYLP